MCLAVPGKTISIDKTSTDEHMGSIEFGVAVKEISLSLVPEAKIGDYVLVHAGFAISIVDEDEALQIFEDIKKIDELEDDKQIELP
ncbi:MAG: HypC/HybG/HupF family hydrogenase formation chaperone [Candidatus Zapsychrus exili]|nr:HypC/HybG/HupF family hydrogenase formation chaperone [Candidatus Zapsychrus exili]